MTTLNKNPLFARLFGTSILLLSSHSVLANPFETYYRPVQPAIEGDSDSTTTASSFWPFSQMVQQTTKQVKPTSVGMQKAAFFPQQQHYQPNPPVQRLPYFTQERARVINQAQRVLGTPYRYGGNSVREGLDCSSLVLHAHQGLGINIPRTSAEQARVSRTIQRSQLRPGDLIFFNTVGRTVSHVGIYLQNGQFIHAASGAGRVMVDDLRKDYWQQRLVKYGTFLR